VEQGNFKADQDLQSLLSGIFQVRPLGTNEADMSIAKTGILLAGLTALFLAAGFMLGGEAGMMIALVFAVGINFFSYWNSDKLVLRMHGAKPVSASNAPQLHKIVTGLCQRSGMPMPSLYIIENDQPNAFATGRNPENAALAATTGLLRHLNDQEITGVMAHELAHVKNRDTLIMTVTATIAGALSMLANFALFFGGNQRNNPLGMVGTILIMILAPLAAMVVQMAISRTREYAADRKGAEIFGQPMWLASALEKLERGASQIDNPSAEANPATAHLFIVNPLHTQKMDGLFSTHPSVSNRVSRLREMTTTPRSRSTIPHSPRRRRPWG